MGTERDARAAGYIVPTYQAAPLAVWYHFLHGNVPGHEIDFIYRPEVPQGPVSQQHFSHLVRLLRYIEPWSRSSYAFAIGNLSRDDTQYEPGRGGVALIFGLRIQGAKDHAGRGDPPFCHAVVAIDRQLDAAWLREVALSFHQKLLPGEDTQASGSGWYHTYLRHGQNADALMPILRAYVGDFEDLPEPPPSALGLRWTVENATPPKRVVIVYREEEAFDAIAACAARIAAVLIASDIKWTAVSTGRETDVVGGVSVRFVPEHEVRAEEEEVPVLRLQDVPEDAGEIASRLFGASAVGGLRVPQLRVGWQAYGRRGASERPRTEPPAERAGEGLNRQSGEGVDIDVVVEEEHDSEAQAGAGNITASIAGDEPDNERQEGGIAEPRDRDLKAEAGTLVPAGGKKPRKNQFVLLIALGMVIAIGGAIAVVLLGTTGAGEIGKAPEKEGAESSIGAAGTAAVAVPPTTEITIVQGGTRPSGAVSTQAPSAASATTSKREGGAAPSGGQKSKSAGPGKRGSVFVVPP